MPIGKSTRRHRRVGGTRGREMGAPSAALRKQRGLLGSGLLRGVFRCPHAARNGWTSRSLRGSPEALRSNAGFTLLEMVIVLAIIGILAAIVSPVVISSLTRAREASLQQDLKILRKLIDDYYADKGAFPPALKSLVEQGYLRAIPGDPVNANKPQWQSVPAKEGGISDIHSLSNERGANGVPYSQW